MEISGQTTEIYSGPIDSGPNSAIQIARVRRCDSNRERAAGSRFKSRAGGGVAIQIASGRRRDSNRERAAARFKSRAAPFKSLFLTSFIAQQIAPCQNAGSSTINTPLSMPISAVAFQQWARFICLRSTCTNRKSSLNLHFAAIGDSLPTNSHSVAKTNTVPFRRTHRSTSRRIYFSQSLCIGPRAPPPLRLPFPLQGVQGPLRRPLYSINSINGL